MKTRIIGLLAALVLVLALCACSTAGTTADGNGFTSATASTSGSKEKEKEGENTPAETTTDSVSKEGTTVTGPNENNSTSKTRRTVPKTEPKTDVLTTKKTTTTGITTAATSQPKKTIPLSEALIKRIKEDALIAMFGSDADKHDAETLDIIAYFGTYNGCVVLMIFGFHAATPVVTTEDIAGFLFKTSYPKAIHVWQNGTFHFLKDAYETGLLTKADIQSIYNYYLDPASYYPR